MTKSRYVAEEYEDAICMVAEGFWETNVHSHAFKKLNDSTVYCKNCGKMIKKDE